MTPFSSDRQLVERIITAMAVTIVSVIRKQLGGGASNPTGPRSCSGSRWPNRCGASARIGWTSWCGAPRRITAAALSPHFDRPLALQYLIVAFCVIGTTDLGSISVGADSPFSAAWDILKISGSLADPLW